jgi:nucleoside 2-deoxyribosyltransferase
MHPLKIYLAGRCKGLVDGGKEWRENARKILETIAETAGTRIIVFDPTAYFDYSEQKYKTQKQIKDYYFHAIRQCDLVLLNLTGTEFSIGTAQEVQYAVDHDIPVIGFGTEHTYPWLSEVDCQVAFDSIHEALDYIRDYYIIGEMYG